MPTPLNFGDWDTKQFKDVVKILNKVDNQRMTKRFANTFDWHSMKIGYNKGVYLYDDKGNIGLDNDLDELIHLVNELNEPIDKLFNPQYEELLDYLHDTNWGRCVLPCIHNISNVVYPPEIIEKYDNILKYMDDTKWDCSKAYANTRLVCSAQCTHDTQNTEDVDNEDDNDEEYESFMGYMKNTNWLCWKCKTEEVRKIKEKTCHICDESFDNKKIYLYEGEHTGECCIQQCIKDCEELHKHNVETGYTCHCGIVIKSKYNGVCPEHGSNTKII